MAREERATTDNSEKIRDANKKKDDEREKREEREELAISAV